MKKYVKPEIEIKKFQSSEAFADLIGSDVFGTADGGNEAIPVSVISYDAAASTIA